MTDELICRIHSFIIELIYTKLMTRQPGPVTMQRYQAAYGRQKHYHVSNESRHAMILDAQIGVRYHHQLDWHMLIVE